MADFATWCNNQGAAADGLHSAVSGVFWWAWNANSGQFRSLIAMNRVKSILFGLESLYSAIAWESSLFKEK